MSDERERQESITDYERAVCYYTIPKTTSPVNLALIFVYALCLFEAVAALVYGLVSDNQTWVKAGTGCLAGIVVLGLVAFTARAFQNEIRRRHALVDAGRTRSTGEVATDVPDPFAEHTLLARPLEQAGDEPFDITDRQGAFVYRVHSGNEGTHRSVSDQNGREIVSASIKWRGRSFSLEGMLPQSAEVFSGETLIGRFKRRFTLGASVVDVECRGDNPSRYTLKDGGIHRSGRLIGRIYQLRNQFYLDVEKSDCHLVLVALFAAVRFESGRSPIF